MSRAALLAVSAALLSCACLVLLAAASPEKTSIRFELKPIPFVLQNDETPARNAPETMPGGVAVFDYDGDGRPDVFFTNGANIATLHKDEPKYRNRLFRNDGNGKFTDVTDAAGLAGTGYDMGVAVADYDNDGHPDLFVAGLHHGTLYHNNGDGTFTDVTMKSGIDAAIKPSRSAVRALVGNHGRVGGRQQRRTAGSFCRQLHAVAIFGQSTVPGRRCVRLLSSALLQGPAKSAFPQQRGWHFPRCFQRMGLCATMSVRRWE